MTLQSHAQVWWIHDWTEIVEVIIIVNKTLNKMRKKDLFTFDGGVRREEGTYPDGWQTETMSKILCD